MAGTIKEEKKMLRKSIKDLLSSIAEEHIKTQSASVTRQALQLPEYRSAKSISIFLSMPGREVSTTEIVRDALRTSKKVFIPYIYASMDDPKQKIMDMLRLKDEADLDSLKPDPWGIPSLSAENIEDRENALGGRGVSVASLERRAAHGLDLVFMPGMAFDNAHNRLGHGRGFYDKYLSQIRRLSQEAGPAQLPTLVGLALREQLLQDDQVVPTTEDDWKVDKLIIPDD